MIKVIIKNYETGEEINRLDVNVKDDQLSDALRDIERMQATTDVLCLGKTCVIKNSGFGLGISSLKHRGCYTYSNDEKIPNEIEYFEGGISKSTGLKVSVSSYKCGLILGIGKEMASGLFGLGGMQPAYIRKITSANVYSGAADLAKTFSSPSKMLKYLQSREDTLRYLVANYGYDYSVNYSTDEYEADIAAFSARRKATWDKNMDELNKFIDELNSTDEISSDDVWASDELKALAKWEDDGYIGEPPYSITENDVLVEAKNRLESMCFIDEVVKLFEEKGKLMMSESMGILYFLDDNAEEAVRLARELGVTPYHVVKSTFEFGTCYDVLYVSNHPSDWYQERKDKSNWMLSYCYNADTEDGEIGSIQVVSINGGVKRIG